jgi:hypothetical protein
VAFTAWKAFDDFGAKVRPTPAQQATIKARRTRVHELLAEAFPAGSSMPLMKTQLIGSVGRNTIIRPVDDVDVLAVFNDSQVWTSMAGDSKKLLYRVRDALDGYATDVVGARGQAVRLFYKDGLHVDIACVVPYGDVYYLPAGNGTWMTTDPDGVDSFLARRQSELGGHLRPLVRLLKRWNNEHSRRLRSFHLELMVQETFSSLSGNYRTGTMRFFEWAPSYIDVADPSGGSSLGSRLTWTQRQNLLSSLASGYTKAKAAVDLEVADDHAGAIAKWKQVFGNEFPSYG